MKPLRILYLCQEYPFPPTNGVRWKLYNIINFMAHAHECHLLGFSAGGNDAVLGHIPHAMEPPRVTVVGIFPPNKGMCLRWRQTLAVVKNRPCSFARWASDAFADRVRMAVRSCKYDVVHLDMVNMQAYQKLLQDTPTVLSINDSVSRYYRLRCNSDDHRWLRAWLRCQSEAHEAIECKTFRSFAAIHVVSSEEKDYLERTAHLPNVRVIPIAVDDKYFVVPPCGEREESICCFSVVGAGQEGSPAILKEFFRLYWPKLQAAHGPTHFTLLGAEHLKPGISTELNVIGGVTLLDWVSDYVATIRNTHIGVFFDHVPGGMKNRVLQLMAAGRPVLGTSAALEGIDGQDGIHYIRFKDAVDLFDNLARLSKSPERRHEIGRNARKLARQLYSAEVVGRKWENLYDEVARNRSRTVTM